MGMSESVGFSGFSCPELVMAKSPTKKQDPKIELEPDAWPRFERFIRDVAKAGPQHRKPPKPGKEKPAK